MCDHYGQYINIRNKQYIIDPYKNYLKPDSVHLTFVSVAITSGFPAFAIPNIWMLNAPILKASFCFQNSVKINNKTPEIHASFIIFACLALLLKP